MINKEHRFTTYFSFNALGQQSSISSVNKQKIRLIERRKTERYLINKGNTKLVIDKGVYKTGVDTELMIQVLSKKRGNKFIEIGCGSGAVSISLANRFIKGIAVDINDAAIINTLENCVLNKINNVNVLKSDVFSNIEGTFDLIVCNPPYNNRAAKDDIEKMFWDKDNEMKNEFFKSAKRHLSFGGKIFFGWADIADVDILYPYKEANKNGLKLIKIYSKSSNCNSFRFLVFEFAKK